jgi:solute carrier family 25 carnitine/acylcarnitine transporter 20/29
VYQNLGLTRGIYRGWLPVCLCRMSNYSYFGSYAVISSSVARMVRDDHTEGEKLPFIASFIAGGASGICFWLSCYPIDVVKNKIQAAPDTWPAKYSGLTGAFRHILRTEGIRGLFVGFTPCALRAFPANAAAFVGFEAAMWLLPE